MELIKYLFDLFLHLDVHLNIIINQYGTLTYIILFLVIFCETGLVVTPFLPGDSLIFAAATFAARGALNVNYLFLILASASFLGDTVNYWIGHFLGPKIFHKENVRFLKKEYLDRTHKFYETYGAKTVLFARFIPIIRTFAPFVAGIGSMTYSKFVAYIILGAVSWVAIFAYGGFYFGNIEFIKNNFSLVIIAVICISLVPGIVGYLKQRAHLDN
ncbi:MAG: DedA family protein [Ignavibacteriaceae bacterium]|jgi:membrane-associated protein